MFRVFIFLLLLISKKSLFAADDDGISVYYYDGIPTVLVLAIVQVILLVRIGIQ